MSLRAVLIFSAAIAALAFTIAACESAVNLNVNYSDAAADAGDEEAAVPPGNELEACPCDESAGLGCCVTTNGPSFCTASESACQAEKGIYMRCVRYNPLHESVCCWHGSGAGALTAYAGGCDGGTSACVDANDCAGQKCTTTKCNDTVVGACGDVAPACP